MKKLIDALAGLSHNAPHQDDATPGRTPTHSSYLAATMSKARPLTTGQTEGERKAKTLFYMDGLTGGLR